MLIVWEYMVRPENVAEFEALYGDDGAWAELFRKSPAYVSSMLVRDTHDRHRYLIADRWESQEAYDSFRREHAAPYDELNARGARLHRAEHLIGRFEDIQQQ